MFRIGLINCFLFYCFIWRCYRQQKYSVVRYDSKCSNNEQFRLGLTGCVQRKQHLFVTRSHTSFPHFASAACIALDFWLVHWFVHVQSFYLVKFYDKLVTMFNLIDCPYSCSLSRRLVTRSTPWCKFLYLRLVWFFAISNSTRAKHDLKSKWLRSLLHNCQTWFLKVSYRLLGNSHLVLNLQTGHFCEMASYISCMLARQTYHIAFL